MDVRKILVSNEPAAFAAVVRALRKDRDLTQRALAELVCCSELTIRKIEAGTRRPSAQIAALLADRLDVSEPERARFLALARRKLSGGQVNGIAHSSLCPKLPSPLGRLIGRENETLEIIRLVTDGGARLLSLTGPPGIGKTRLAIQAGWDLIPRFPDGAWFVALDVLAAPDAVAGEIARAIGAPVRAGVSETESIVQWLGDRSALLVLDNFEHVLRAASLVADVLVRCPGAVAIVTSREALHLRGERTFAVPPLALPCLSAPWTLTKLAANHAVALFTEAAASVAPDFTLNEHNARAVAEICVAVDGLPLALELLAGHMNVISAPALAAQLDASKEHSALALLDRGPVDLPKRQRVLRHAIADSFGVLEPTDQTTFVRLGVFPGDFSLQAAFDVAAEEGDPPSSIAERVGVLVEKNLLKRAHDDAAAPRYVMLRAIREFAREQLSENDRDTVKERHAKHYLSLAMSLSPPGALPPESLHRLETEHHNVRAALLWSLAQNRSDIAAPLAAALWPFWWRRGHLNEGRRYLERVLEHQTTLEGALRAELLLGAGTLARSQSCYGDAQRFLHESVALWHMLDDHAGIARALKEAGTVADCRGDFAEARDLLMQSIDIFEQLGDEGGVATALGNLGIVEQEQGHLDVAQRHHTRSLTLRRRLADRSGVAIALNNLGLIARQRGNWSAAASSWEQSLAFFRELGDEQNVAASLNNLGMSALALGDGVRATACHEESRALAERLSDRLTWAIAVGHLADVALQQRDPARAAMLLAQSLVALEQLGESAQIASCLGRLADVALMYGQWARSVTLMTAAESVMEVAGVRASPADASRNRESLIQARSMLGEIAWNEAWTMGRAMTRERAIEFALEAASADEDGGGTDRPRGALARANVRWVRRTANSETGAPGAASTP